VDPIETTHYEPEPPVLPPPQPKYEPVSAKPDWLSGWVTALKTTPTPDLPKPTVQVADPKPKAAYGITSSYSRKWGRGAYTKPEVKSYQAPLYKPVRYTPKPYTAAPVSYKRPEPVVEKKVVEKKEKKSYSSYDSDDKKYLRTYYNKYTGTVKKPHSHQSCLQRMLARFSKYNSIVRKRRA